MTDVCLSSELQLFVLELDNPVVISGIYRPPEPHKDFLRGIMPNFNRDTYMCVVEEFLTLVDTFYLVQLVNAPPHIQVIGPTVQKITNSCLEMATVPDDMKHAVVHPLPEKPNLYPTVLTNFSLSSMSKMWACHRSKCIKMWACQ